MSAVNPETGLTVLQTKAVQLLLEGLTFKNVSEELKVTERTLWRWRKQTAFQRALHRGMLESYNNSGGQGVSILPEIISVLTSIMRSTQALNSDRISAAKVLINSANEFQLRKALEAQVFELEARLMKLTRMGLGEVSTQPAPALDVQALPPQRRSSPEDDEDFIGEGVVDDALAYAGAAPTAGVAEIYDPSPPAGHNYNTSEFTYAYTAGADNDKDQPLLINTAIENAVSSEIVEEASSWIADA